MADKEIIPRRKRKGSNRHLFSFLKNFKWKISWNNELMDIERIQKFQKLMYGYKKKKYK